jgi:hypothetical protein
MKKVITLLLLACFLGIAPSNAQKETPKKKKSNLEKRLKKQNQKKKKKGDTTCPKIDC